MIPTNEQPYPLPEGWQWVILDSVAEIIMGQSPKGDATTYDSSYTPLIGGAADMGEEFPSITRYTKKPTKLSSSEDVIICVRATLGKPIFSDSEYCLGRGVAALRPRAALKDFIRYALINFEQYLYDNAKGTTFLQIASHQLKRMPIPLPPLDEQQRIVDLLDEMFDKLDEAKTLAQAVVDSAEFRRATILHKAFIGELTKLWRDEHGTTLDRWQQCQLGDVCNYGRNETVQPSAMKIGKLLIDLEDIEKDSGNLIKQKIFDGTNANSSKHSFGRGDVLYGKLRPYLNKVVIADEDGYCSSEILPLNFGERALNRFAQYVLLSPDFVRYANHNSYGTNMPRLGTRAGRQAPFPLPPLEEQKEIVRVLDDMLDREQRTKDLAIKTLERIELMKKSILARAFRGELDSKNF